MAMSCVQLLNPRACRSALCSWTEASNSGRGINCRIWLKMLHTRFMMESPSLVWVLLGTQSNVAEFHLLLQASATLTSCTKANLDKSVAEPFPVRVPYGV